MKYDIKVEQIAYNGPSMTLAITGTVKTQTEDGYVPRAKLILYFENGKEDRRIPFVFSSQERIGGAFYFSGKYTYNLDYLFWNTRAARLPMRMSFILSCGLEYEEHVRADFSRVEILEENLHYDYHVQDDEIVFQQIAGIHSGAGIPQKLARVCLKTGDFLLAFCLLPWFVVDALAGVWGAVELAPSVKNTNPVHQIVGHVNYRFSGVTGYRLTAKNVKRALFIFFFQILKKKKTHPRKITFISQRREELSGNFEFVYNRLKQESDLEIGFIFNTKLPEEMNLKEIWRFCLACATSKVIVLDEYTPQIHYFDLKKDTKLIQLWHACGAFKTFGFTRLGKPLGSPQKTRMHRSYDYVTVSSSYCKKCHSEGFGIATDKVVATGIPRTDVFFDEQYRVEVRERLYREYPVLKGKQVILFAPTFRGPVKESAYYPVDKFDVGKIMDQLGDGYAMIIKHHPFVRAKQPIPKKYADRVIDLSGNSELNDLMFISDLIITDYSSLVFEASLLEIPMLFYVYDLQEYIADRDFYFDLKLMSPGKLVYTQEELVEAIQNRDFCEENLEQFKHLFFDNLDGKATQRVADLILRSLA